MTVQIRNYVAPNEPTVHDCADPQKCPVPAWWQDPCSIYHLLEEHHNLITYRREQIQTLTETVQEALSRNSQQQPLASVLSAVTAWQSQTPPGNDTFQKFIRTRLGTNVTIPTPRRLSRKDTARNQRIAEIEQTLVVCYQERIAEARNRYVRRTGLTPSETEDMGTVTFEAFLKSIRSYSLDAHVPLQPYLRTMLPRRITDVLRSERNKGRKLQAYEVACAKYLHHHPQVRHRRDAALHIGYSLIEIEDYETLIKLREPMSFEAWASIDSGVTPGREDCMTPLNQLPCSDHTDGSPRGGQHTKPEITPEQIAAARDAIREMHPDEMEVVEAFLANNQDALAKSLGVRPREITVSANRILERLRGDTTPDGQPTPDLLPFPSATDTLHKKSKEPQQPMLQQLAA